MNIIVESYKNLNSNLQAFWDFDQFTDGLDKDTSVVIARIRLIYIMLTIISAIYFLTWPLVPAIVLAALTITYVVYSLNKTVKVVAKMRANLDKQDAVR